MTKEKMTFVLEKDEDGYPADDFETVWVEQIGKITYRIDNIPFYITGVSPDDIVEGEICDQTLMFRRLINKSEISVIRLIFFNLLESNRIIDKLVGFGCRWEGSHLKQLFSVEVPKLSDYNAIIEMLENEAASDILDYEEASRR